MDIAKIKDCIGNILERDIYYCGADQENISIYAKDEKTRIQLVELFRKNGKSDPEFNAIKVLTTRSLKFKKARSLEEIISRVPHQSVYLDPTATIERSSVLVSIAKQARHLLGSLLKGCYFNSSNRKVYFLLKDNDPTINLSAIQKQLEPIITSNTQRLSHPFYYSITISLRKPQGSIIAIDKASVVNMGLGNVLKSVIHKLKWPLLVASASSSLGIATANAEDACLPAVSKTNGWIGAAADYLHNQRTSGAGGIVDGGIAVPLCDIGGAQLHTYDGFAGNAGIASVDGYIFWRNPVQGLLGPHVTYTKSNSYHHTFYGLHGEGYLNNLTLVLEGGGADRSGRSNTYYGEAIVHWYAQPDWRLYAGAIAVGGDTTGEIGTEYQLGLSSLPGLSIFADAGVGAHSLSYGFLGLRFYFGDIKPLVCRQREDMVLPTLDPIDPIDHKQKPTISSM